MESRKLSSFVDIHKYPRLEIEMKTGCVFLLGNSTIGTCIYEGDGTYNLGETRTDMAKIELTKFDGKIELYN